MLFPSTKIQKRLWRSWFLSRGFGFARPNGGEDIFIHGSMLNSAFVGDKIFVGGIRKDDKGYSGNIMQILERARGQPQEQFSLQNMELR